MNTEKLERANILAKSLIPKVNELLNMSTKSMRSSLADAIYGLSECDEYVIFPLLRTMLGKYFANI